MATRRGACLTLSKRAGLGLFFIQRYRFLTIDQFARISGQTRAASSEQLRALELAGFLGHFGNTGLAGYGKTPKACYLTRKGYELLKRESDVPTELIGSYKEVHIETKWSPQMYHRLRTVDLMIAAEVAVRGRLNLTLVQTFLEYKRVKRNNRIERETMDFVALPETSENRIIPDAAFIIENIQTAKRGLFFIEMDMATERIVTEITRDKRITLFYKLTQYDRYLQGMRYSVRYREFGEFQFFTLLFVTFGTNRVENILREMQALPSQYAQYYRFAVFEHATADFLGAVWRSRSFADQRLYPLVREA
jgi:Replication-relaxation